MNISQDSELRYVQDTIAGSTTAGASTEGNADVVDIGTNEAFRIERVDLMLDADATLSCKARVTVDGEALAPGTGFIAGGGERFPLEVEREIITASVVRIHFDNGDSSSRDILVVLNGQWVRDA